MVSKNLHACAKKRLLVDQAHKCFYEFMHGSHKKRLARLDMVYSPVKEKSGYVTCSIEIWLFFLVPLSNFNNLSFYLENGT